MDPDLVVNVVSTTAVVASLVFAALQTRSLKRQTEAANRLALSSEGRQTLQYLHEILRIFLDHPEWRPWFFAGRVYHEALHDVRIPLVGEMLADVLEVGLDTVRTVTTEDSPDWFSYCDYVLHVSPIVLGLVREHPDWWPGLSEIARRSLGDQRAPA